LLIWVRDAALGRCSGALPLEGEGWVGVCGAAGLVRSGVRFPLPRPPPRRGGEMETDAIRVEGVAPFWRGLRLLRGGGGLGFRNKGRAMGRKRLTGVAQRLRREPTDAEACLWRHLRGRQLGAPFTRQCPIGD